jgi:hypothetical protein
MLHGAGSIPIRWTNVISVKIDDIAAELRGPRIDPKGLWTGPHGAISEQASRWLGRPERTGFERAEFESRQSVYGGALSARIFLDRSGVMPWQTAVGRVVTGDKVRRREGGFCEM